MNKVIKYFKNYFVEYQYNNQLQKFAKLFVKLYQENKVESFRINKDSFNIPLLLNKKNIYNPNGVYGNVCNYIVQVTEKDNEVSLVCTIKNAFNYSNECDSWKLTVSKLNNHVTVKKVANSLFLKENIADIVYINKNLEKIVQVKNKFLSTISGKNLINVRNLECLLIKNYNEFLTLKNQKEEEQIYINRLKCEINYNANYRGDIQPLSYQLGPLDLCYLFNRELLNKIEKQSNNVINNPIVNYSELLLHSLAQKEKGQFVELVSKVKRDLSIEDSTAQLLNVYCKIYDSKNKIKKKKSNSGIIEAFNDYLKTIFDQKDFESVDFVQAVKSVFYNQLFPENFTTKLNIYYTSTNFCNIYEELLGNCVHEINKAERNLIVAKELVTVIGSTFYNYQNYINLFPHEALESMIFNNVIDNDVLICLKQLQDPIIMKKELYERIENDLITLFEKKLLVDEFSNILIKDATKVKKIKL